MVSVDLRVELEGAMALQCRVPDIEGFKAYCEYVREEPLLPRQVEWAKILLRDGDDVITAPPGTYKTSLCRKLLEWLIGIDQESGNLWLMNSEVQSMVRVSAIAAAIEHLPRYGRVFPAVRPDKERGWSKTVLFIHRQRVADDDPTLFGSGYKGGYQGFHPQRILMDDMTNQWNVYEPSVMRTQRDVVRGVIADRLTPIEGRLAQGRKVIMTRWGETEYDDLLETYRALGYRIHDYPIEGDYTWGRHLALDVYDDERLQNIQEAKEALVIGDEEVVASAGMYQTTFMCNPGSAGGGIIKRDWWKYYHEMPKFHHVIHSWDLATGRGKGHDYTAYTAWGRADNGYYLIDLDRWQDVGSPLTVARQMQVLYTAPEGLRPRDILVEDVGISTGVVDYLKQETNLPIVPVKPGMRDKKARVQGILGLIQNGKIWLPSSEALRRKVEVFVTECSRFTGKGDRHDDYVDSMSQGLKFLLKRSSSTGEAGAPMRRKGDFRNERTRRWQTRSRTQTIYRR